MLQASHPIENAPTGHAATQTPSNSVLIVLGVSLFSAGLFVLPWWFGTISILQYVYPVLALAIGIVLYRTFPIAFVGYAWWLWFLTPFVRRVVDYHTGVYQSPSMIIYAPHFVSALAFLTLVRHRKRLLDKDYFPFVLVIVGLAYGYVIGILDNGLISASYGLLKWITPLLLGLHVAFYWRDYPALRSCIQRTFLWGVAVMGAYAVIQFYALPPWDVFWMTHVDFRGGSLGLPRPFLVRPFSTLTSYSPFTTVMMAGLLVLFSISTWKHLLVALPGYAGFLIPGVRTAWGGWLLGLMLMALWIKGDMHRRLVGMLVLGALVFLSLLTVPEISRRVGNRFETFQNLEEDNSLNARLAFYKDTSLRVMTNPIGSGIGFDIYKWDSGLLVIPHQLGWPGLLLFVTGILLFMRRIWLGRRRTSDPFAAISVAIALAILAMLAFKNSLPDVSGAVFWCFGGLALASAHYHNAQVNDNDCEDTF